MFSRAVATRSGFSFMGSIMLRFAAIALALSAVTAAPTAHAAEDTAKVATPSDFGCAMRMMFIGMKSREALKNPTMPEDKRPGAEKVSTDSRQALSYYLGRLGPAFSATNRSDEGQKLFAEMLAKPKEDLSMEIAVCLTNAQKAENDALKAMKSPTAK